MFVRAWAALGTFTGFHKVWQSFRVQGEQVNHGSIDYGDLASLCEIVGRFLEASGRVFLALERHCLPLLKNLDHGTCGGVDQQNDTTCSHCLSTSLDLVDTWFQTKVDTASWM